MNKHEAIERTTLSLASSYPLNEADDTFLANATCRHVHIVDLPAPVPRVWDALVADDALVSWSPVVTDANWTSPRPFGVGATRNVTYGHVFRVTERLYRWDDDERMSFTVDTASIPGMRRLAEDIRLVDKAGGTRLTWTFAMEGETPLRQFVELVNPVSRFITSTIASGVYARLLRRHDWMVR
ncbi:SRPBCC family protein [Nocardia callitridis]|uniref:SRPBCC family protein n=1 Tax=Nocardia callitridis TaxID=648753 RepID=A0ABP9KTS8_9NOCA